jgi:anthranilate synthase component 1
MAKPEFGLGPERPDFDTFERLAREANVIPIVRELFSDSVTPVTAYATVGKRPGSYLLESVTGGEKWGRYSFVGFDPEMLLRGAGDRLEIERRHRALEIRRGDPWSLLREELSRFRPARAETLPRFSGGAVGYVPYDAVHRFEPKALALEGEALEFSFALGGTLLVFDDVKKTLSIVALAHLHDGDDRAAVYEDALERIEHVADMLARPAQLRALVPERERHTLELPPSSFDRPSFVKAVEKAKEHIRAGDIFQVVLSQRFRVPLGAVDPLDLYRAMRVINPSPYMYFLRFPEVVIAGASPETLVRLEDRVAHVRPIAGTKPRGKTDEDDRAHAEALLADPKERAEHVMLVDLARNDLGRVCVPGTVSLGERMTIERYSHVMHMVTNVTGTLDPSMDAIDLLRATFPAGTLSGAPKVRAMQIIDDLEPEPRAIYGGAIGYLGYDGNMDLAIAIRTAVVRGNDVLLQAGAGIVEASDPDREYDETVSKARGVLVALDLARTR